MCAKWYLFVFAFLLQLFDFDKWNKVKMNSLWKWLLTKKHQHLHVFLFLYTDTIMLHGWALSVHWGNRAWSSADLTVSSGCLSSPHGQIHKVLLEMQGFQFVSFPQDHESMMRGLNWATGGSPSADDASASYINCSRCGSTYSTWPA